MSGENKNKNNPGVCSIDEGSGFKLKYGYQSYNPSCTSVFNHYISIICTIKYQKSACSLEAFSHVICCNDYDAIKGETQGELWDMYASVLLLSTHIN